MLNKKHFIPLALILFTTIFIYSPSFKNPFIWDDFHLVVNDENIKSFNNLPIIFKTHLYQHIGGSNFYRPIQSLSFMLDYSIWKLKPFGYHLTNLFFHLLTVILVYFFVRRIFDDTTGLLTSLIFAVHPINTEAITYIAGRADPLSAFFFLASLLFYIRFKNDKGKRPFFFIMSILFFLVSLLTKEAILIFPLVLILYDALALKQDSITLRSIKIYTPYFLVLFLYIFFRLFILGLPLGLIEHIPFKSYLLTMPKIIILYLWLLFFPINLHMERLEPITYSISDPQAIVSIITLICIIWLSILISRRSKPLFFCISFFFITLLPMLNLLTINAPMAEHWLYLPSIGMYSIVSFGLVRIIDFKKSIIPNEAILRSNSSGSRRNSKEVSTFGIKQALLSKFVVFIFIGFLSFFSIRTVLRNCEWGRPFEFYKDILKYTPHSARVHLNLGSIYMSLKDYKKAKQEFTSALELNPANPLCYQALGFLDFIEDKKSEGIKKWKMALDIAPFNRPTREIMNKALYMENKKFRKLLKAITVNPKNIMAYYRLSKMYMQNGLYLEALAVLEKLLEIDPNYTDALFNRAWLYSKLGLYEKAIQEYKKLLKVTPDDSQIYTNLSFCYAYLNKQKEAEEAAHKALQHRH